MAVLPMPRKLDADGKILWKAANLLEKKGWCRFILRDRAGRLCLLGAANLAMRRNPFWSNCDDTIPARLGFRNWEDAVAWNNDTKRRRTQVVSLLRRCAQP